MAWRLLSLLLFYSLAVVWADPVPTPDYEETLPLRQSACWVSIKMSELTEAESWFQRMLHPKLLKYWKSLLKTLPPYDWPKHLELSNESKGRVIETAGIRVFKRMTCSAAPEKSEDLNKCQEAAFDACSAEEYNSVTLIYEIQQWKKRKLHESLLQLVEKIKTDKQFEIVIFIDCQEATDLDMNENPSGCQGGIRLDFDPTFSKDFPRAQIEIHSHGNLSDNKIYPGGLLAREKVKGNFLMNLDDDISSKCLFVGSSTGRLRHLKRFYNYLFAKKVYPNNEVRAIKATNEGVVLFDSNHNTLTAKVQKCVFKNTLSKRNNPARSLQIYRRKGDIEERLEQKLQPNESVKVELLPHIEIYPFFCPSEPLPVVGRFEKPLYVYHFKIMDRLQIEGHPAVEFKTEELKHKNSLLRTVTCWADNDASAAVNCSGKVHTLDGHKIFVSSGSRISLLTTMRMLLTPARGVQVETNWTSFVEEKLLKFRFIKVGAWYSESDIPDPKLVLRRFSSVLVRVKDWFSSLLGLKNDHDKIETQPLPGFTKNELHLDVALFHAYHPVYYYYTTFDFGSPDGHLACFENDMELEFSGWKYEVYVTGKADKERRKYELGSDNRVKLWIPAGQFPTFVGENQGIRDLYKMSLVLKQQEDNEIIPDMTINCGDWQPKTEGNQIKVKSPTVDITFLRVDMRSTSIFPTGYP